MISLDLRTVFATYTGAGFVCLAVFVVLWRQNRKRYPGLLFLVGDLALQAVGTFLIALRGTVPDWLSMVVSNCLLIGGILLGFMGLQRLLKLKGRNVHNYVLLAAFALVQIYFTHFDPRLDVRILNTAAIQLLVWPQYAWVFTRGAARKLHRPVRIMAPVFVAYTLISLARIGAVLAGQYPEGDYLHTGGAEIPILLAFELLLILFTFGVALTVNDLLSAELRMQEERFSKAFRSAPNAVLLSRLDSGEIVEVNDAFTIISGYEPEEAVGSTTTGLGLWAREEDRNAMSSELNAGGKVHQSEYLFRRKSGQPFAGLFSAEVIAIGEEKFILANVGDIDERKRAEDELIRQQKENELLVERLDHAQSIAKIGSWELDLRTGHVWWSKETYDLFGVSSETYVPGFDTNQDYIHPDDREQYAARFAESVATLTPLETVVRLVPAEGPLRHCFVKAVIFCDDSGKPARFAGILMDITDSILAEERLRESQGQLLQAQKMEAVGQLAGGIAHDFNNLLGVILGYTELALATTETGEQDPREYLTAVKGAAERASALTKQILAFSRRQTLRPVVLSLNEVVTGIEPLLRRTLGEDIELTTILDPELANVEADPHQLEQVLMNLAVNSRDAMSSGGILTIRTSNLIVRTGLAADERAVEALDSEDLVVLAVADTGVGMDAGTRARVFEPFFSTKDPAMGTGLGMSVVYGVVKQSRGHIDVESEPGQGTAIRIYLPRTRTVARREEVSAQYSADLEGRETVLVVEDEEALRGLVGQFLEGLGYRVITSSAAVEALALARDMDVAFDVALTDVVLPGAMQGSDLARALEQVRPGLPILYMSGYPRDAIVRAGRLGEGISLIEKPFTRDQLAAAIRQVLDRRSKR